MQHSATSYVPKYARDPNVTNSQCLVTIHTATDESDSGWWWWWALTVVDTTFKKVSGLFQRQELVFAQEGVVHTISFFRPRSPEKRSAEYLSFWIEVWYLRGDGGCGSLVKGWMMFRCKEYLFGPDAKNRRRGKTIMLQDINAQMQRILFS